MITIIQVLGVHVAISYTNFLPQQYYFFVQVQDKQIFLTFEVNMSVSTSRLLGKH